MQCQAKSWRLGVRNQAVIRRLTPKVLNCASTECHSAKHASDLSPTENFAASADKYRYYRANWVRNGGQVYVSGI